MEPSNKAIIGAPWEVNFFADDEAASGDLLANTNKLLAAVGISAKTILSLEELARVASSMFVAVFEALFHLRIEDVIRNPVTKDDYEKNAQLVVDYLSEQIQMDLKHITGKSIVSGDVKALSNLVHILARIVSITTHDALSSIESEFSSERERDRNYRMKYGQSPASVSLSTPDSAVEDREIPTRPKSARRYDTKKSSFDSSAFYNQFLHSSLTKAESYLEQEEKLALARKRRENNTFVRESQSKVQNMKHAEVSQRALQQRWREDQAREQKSHALKKSNEENVMLRKIYQNLLWKVMQWRIEEEAEARDRSKAIKDHARWHAEALHTLFEDRLNLLKEQDEALLKSKEKSLKEENIRTRDLLKSIADRRGSLIVQVKNNSEQRKSKELLRRRETHDNLLSLLSVEGTFQRQHPQLLQRKSSKKRSSSAPRASRRYQL